MRASSFVLGYHGCDREVGEKILAGNDSLKASENDYDWLGRGIYFWENNAQRALDWAEFLQTSPLTSSSKVKDPFVLGAIIDLGNCLDLLEAESIDIVKKAYLGLQSTFSAVGVPLPENKTAKGELLIRRLDCAVINFVHERGNQQNELQFDSVRAAFMEGGSIYENSGFHSKTHIQLCVRDPQQIIGYFRPINSR